MKFENHAPINLESATTVAEVNDNWDFGHSFTRLVRGKQFHLYSSKNDGRFYGNRQPKTYRVYLFGSRSLEEVKAFLKEKAAEMAPDPYLDLKYYVEVCAENGIEITDHAVHPWAAALLEKLGDFGTEA